MRFVVDSSWRWIDAHSILAGSPLKLFRLSEAGTAIVRSLEAGDEVDLTGPTSVLIDRLLDAGAVHPVVDSGAPHRSAADVTVVTPQLGGAVAREGRLVVDDGSEPPLDGAALRLDTNVGPGGARNEGRPLVDTPFVAFVDADVDVPELRPDHPGHEKFWATLLAHFIDDRVGLVAPRVVGDPGSSLDLGDAPARIRAGTRVSYVPAAMIVVRATAFDDVGGFDPTLRSGEDVDLVWRLDDAGWRCRYEPTVSVHHRPRATRRERWTQQVVYGSSSAPLALRHPRSLAPWKGSGWVAATWVSLALGHPVGAAGAAAIAVGRFRRLLPDLDNDTLRDLTFEGYLGTGRHAAAAVRRAWWPLAIPFIWSKRVRRVLLVAVAVAPRAVPNDVAFSFGLWKSVLRTRDVRSLLPQIAGSVD